MNLVPPGERHTAWRRSSYSGGGSGNCVEVATPTRHIVAIRDSKNPDGPRLAFSREPWMLFLGSVKSGAYRPYARVG